LTFKIYAPEKAHSGNDIMIEVVEEKVLFLGDNVLARRIGRLDDATFVGSIAACERAEKVPARVFVPGHGKTGGKAIVTAYKDYLKALFAAVQKEYDNGKADYEMKDAVRAQLKPWHGWHGFDDHLGKHISLAYLEVEAM
jgi:glyoxylase-like metal-dependent hydrolase (beta-lactamase superfamily II)